MTAVIKSYHAVFRWWYSAKINCSKLSGHLYLWSRFECTQLHILIQQIQIIWDVNHPYTIDMSTIHISLLGQPSIYYCDVNKSVKFLLRRQDYHDFAPWWLKHQNGDGEMNIFIFHKHFFLLI